jgi:DNA mismatch repair ATPase MutS
MDDFRQQLMATGEITADKSDDMHEVTLWMNEPAQFSNHWFYRVAYVFFPLLSAVLIVFTLINPDFYRLLVLLFLLQLMIVGLKLRTTTRIHGLLSRQLDTFKKLNRLLEHIQREEFRASHLKDLKDHFYTGGHPAQKAVRQLSKILSAFDNRLNVLAGLMLNGFLLWDVQCLVRLENWKRRYRNHFPAWVDSLAEMDALISLATFHFNHPDFCFPEFTDEVILRTTAMGHPLIAGQERVCNDFLIPSEGSVVIITGANMAGKSTFLRSVGVNMVLAMTGAPVCAEAFSFRPLALFTSMRTSDSLHHHESYFYAELKRIKSIVDELLTGKKMLIILDEILKGTNSADKHRGSVAVLNRIMALKGTGIIATHDLELAHTAVKASGQIINQCFEIEIRGAEVFFDYRLRDGITQKMNASLLMQQMGIVSQ